MRGFKLKMFGVLALVGVTGCKVTDAPESLEELVVYGFRHFDDEDAEPMRAMYEGLVPRVQRNLDEMSKGYRVNDLTVGDLEQVGVTGAEVGGIVGAVGAATYRHGIDDVLQGVTLEDKVSAYDTYLAYSVDNDTDLDCFLARDCERYDATITQTAKVQLLGEATHTYDIAYRWVTADDGEDFVVARTLAPQPIEFSTSISKVHQQYAFVVLQPLGSGGVRRIETFWVDAEMIGMDVPDYFAVESAAKQMQKQADSVDAWLDAR